VSEAIIEDVYSPHRQKTHKNTIKNRLQYDETIQYNILQYSRVKKIETYFDRHHVSVSHLEKGATLLCRGVLHSGYRGFVKQAEPPPPSPLTLTTGFTTLIFLIE